MRDLSRSALITDSKLHSQFIHGVIWSWKTRSYVLQGMWSSSTKVTTCGAHHRHFVLLQADNWMMLWVPWALRLLWPSSACLVSMTAPVLLAFSEHGRAIPTTSFLIDLHQQSLLLDSFVSWGRDHILIVYISRKRCQLFDSLMNKTVSCMHVKLFLLLPVPQRKWWSHRHWR